MSYDDEPDYYERPPSRRQRDTRHLREPRDSGGGGFLTGLMLVGLLAGGYYAWKQVDPGAPAQHVAESPAAPPVSAPAYQPDSNAGFERAAPEPQPDVAETPVKQAESETPIRPAENAAAENAVLPPILSFLRGTPAPPRQAAPAAAQQPAFAQPAAAEIQEATIGVSTAAMSDDVVVNGRRPIWQHTPRAERLAEYYPASALDRGREGEAQLHCMIGEHGKLDCERVSEYPERAGFGLAALKVARTLRHVEQRSDGRSAIGTPLNLRVVFRMPEGQRREGSRG